MAGAWYKVVISGVSEYPGEDVWIDDVFVSKFDFRKWEHEPGGIEFDINYSLFDKPYQSDDFEVAIIEDFYSGFDTEIITDLAGYTTITNYLAISGIDHYAWIKGEKFLITGQNTSSGKYAIEFDQAETFGATTPPNFYINKGSTQHTMNRYQKTGVGLQIVVYDQTGTIRFCGRVSEPISVTSKVLAHITVKDELDCLDIDIPDSSSSNYGYTLYSLIVPFQTLRVNDSPDDEAAFAGEVFRLEGMQEWIEQNGYPMLSLSSCPRQGAWDTFAEFYADYLKLTAQFITLSQIYDSTLGYDRPQFRFNNISQPTRQFISPDTICLADLLSTDSVIETKLSNGLSAAEITYRKTVYRGTNIFSTNYGTGDKIAIEVPEFVTLKENNGSDFDPQGVIEKLINTLAVVYQEISIESDSRIDNNVEEGRIYLLDQQSQDDVDTFVESGISDIAYCINRSEDVFTFLHLKDQILDPCSAYYTLKDNDQVTTPGLVFAWDSWDGPLSKYNASPFSISDYSALGVEDTGYLYFEVGDKVILRNLDAGGVEIVRTITNITTDGKFTIDIAMPSTTGDRFVMYFAPTTTSGMPARQKVWFELT